MNPGGEPERDDTGLPPVDIEIPDDARDLDRDVQSYRREMRALRRTRRQGRWRRSLSRDGVALPLLACCLILALISGTLLTVFTATSNPSLTGPPGSSAPVTIRPGPTTAGMVLNQAPPDGTITVGSAAVPLQSLNASMLVLVPAHCGCGPTLSWLAAVASRASVPVFVISTRATEKEVDQLYRQLDSQLRRRVQLAEETDSTLSPANFPAGVPAGQLTAILLGPDHSATWVFQMNPYDSQARLVQALTG